MFLDWASSAPSGASSFPASKPNKAAFLPAAFASPALFSLRGREGGRAGHYTGERSAPVLIPLCCGGPATARQAVKVFSSGQNRQGAVAELLQNVRNFQRQRLV
ncbi:hypothetical protein E2320_013215, partial [Naja naja]